MKELDWKELDKIPIPEGLEERLSKSIDRWEQQEKLTVRPPLRWLKWTSVAACVAVVATVGLYFSNRLEDTTYTQAEIELARVETQRAVDLLVYNLNRGVGQLEKAKAASDRIEETFNRFAIILE